MNDLSSRILYLDNACVVINKLSGEAIEAAPKNGAASSRVGRTKAKRRSAGNGCYPPEPGAVGLSTASAPKNGAASSRVGRTKAKRRSAGNGCYPPEPGAVDNGTYKVLIPDCVPDDRRGATEHAASAEDRPDERLAVPVPVHRLDVPVTGCVVFARTRSALGFLSAAFGRAAAGKDVPLPPAAEKRYWAVVERPPGEISIPGAGELRHWLRFDSQKNKSFACDKPGPGRKEALLTYRLIGTGRNYLFLDIELVTGRHHQIRAQLARVGLHIKGDLKYGARRSEKNGGIRLHARSVSFPDPSGNGGRQITVTAGPPLRDNLWAAFEEAAASGGNPFSVSGAKDGEN